MLSSYLHINCAVRKNIKAAPPQQKILLGWRDAEIQKGQKFWIAVKEIYIIKVHI